jgi:predicted restriction endonuclease
MPVNRTIRQKVQKRANHYCEYCKRSEAIQGRELEIDHIKPQSQGGTDDIDNLAYACHDCNQFKQDRIQCTDPTTGLSSVLFNPRTQKWDEHFEWSSDTTTLIGLSPEGRATVSCLQLNTELLQAARKIWQLFAWPPI